MKHAGAAALGRLADLLGALRGMPALTERSPGVFYRKGRAFLHFHEDAAGLFADCRLSGDDFDRFAVTSTAEQARLIETVRGTLDDTKIANGRNAG